MTKIYISPSDNVYFNLAAESYFLHKAEDDIVLLYVNKAAVVVGKHQNIYQECRISTCQTQNVNLARRLSGGGTVFHGLGNINFCFIKNLADDEPLVDFQKHLKPVIGFLQELGLPAEFSGRNDILINGLKVSGNAEHVYQKSRRLIHHGTLLFDANLKLLADCIAPKIDLEFESHAVESVRSKVSNIRELLPSKLSEQKFISALSLYLRHYFGAVKETFNQDQIKEISKLVDTKFETWEWIFGYSPTFTFRSLDGWEILVKKGIIQQALRNDAVVESLTGKPFKIESFGSLIDEDLTPEILSNWF